MKNLFILSLLFLGILSNAQSPQLNVKGKDSVQVKMSQLLVNVKVVGNIAYTTAEMHFTNTSNRQMEAELLFPLPEGVSVSRYAIDINGKMREAVPVDKSKGKQVFEAIEHRRVDPGLLEKVEGNNFRTRIYPIMPNKERIVIIGYEEELSSFDKNNLAYQLVSRYPQKLEKFELKINVLGAVDVPTINDVAIDKIEATNWNQSYETKISKVNYQPTEKLLIKIPIKIDIPSVVVQTINNQNYFYANTVIDNVKIAKKNPNSIGIIWDNSLSCKNRDLKKELSLLDAYFTKIQNTQVTLYLLNYNFRKSQTFAIANGDWSTLKTQLESTVYDGGTRFSKIKLDKNDEYLFFTDGLSSLSINEFDKINAPIYTVTSLASSDYAFLNYNALITKGNFINLNQFSVENALDKLTNQSLKFLGIKENYLVTELYPIIGTPVSGSFSIAGISMQNTNEVVLLFGYNDQTILEKKIVININNQATNEVNIEKLWAQKKIASLEIQYKKNADEIETLGKKFGIITQNTSLIVLENMSDYIMYDIVPPTEMREEFDRIMKQNILSMAAKKVSNWQNVERYYNELQAWWKADMKYKKPEPPKVVEQVKKRNSGQEVTSSGTANGIVQGTISDENGQPLAGANIRIKGTRNAVSTDFEGIYSINAKIGQTLVYEFMGMQSREVRLGNANVYNVRLKELNNNLQEVVVTGMGVKKMKRSVGYATQTVRAMEVNEAPRNNMVNEMHGDASPPPIQQDMQGKVAGIQIQEANALSVNKDVRIRGNSSISDKKNEEDDDEIEVEKSIVEKPKTKVNTWNPDRVYLKALASVPQSKKYEVYMKLREANEQNPSFYFDVANSFYNSGDKETALLVLSNIADLGLENHQLYKSLTYVLRQWEAFEDALFTANQVVKWRNFEPQSHRDLALTLEDNNQFQAAFDELIKALEVNYFGEMSGQYAGVEDIILMDINRLVASHKKINTDKLDKKYLDKMPVEVRIILNWNQMDVDIDLHVIEPTGEECYYGHKTTEIGARFSKDFTQGYGPEQYILRNAVKGKFQIKTNFFGERTLTESGPTTVNVEIYTTKNGKTERKMQTIQLGKVREKENLAEITID
jgi:Vault protein inter-alpha-trypsin domain/CarboxypepD_reg-like domain